MTCLTITHSRSLSQFSAVYRSRTYCTWAGSRRERKVKKSRSNERDPSRWIIMICWTVSRNEIMFLWLHFFWDHRFPYSMTYIVNHIFPFSSVYSLRKNSACTYGILYIHLTSWHNTGNSLPPTDHAIPERCTPQFAGPNVRFFRRVCRRNCRDLMLSISSCLFSLLSNCRSVSDTQPSGIIVSCFVCRTGWFVYLSLLLLQAFIPRHRPLLRQTLNSLNARFSGGSQPLLEAVRLWS